MCVVLVSSGLQMTSFAGTDSITVSETGTNAKFKVRLRMMPTHSVTIALTPADASEFTLSTNLNSGISLTFLSSAWSTFQTVTATGVDDNIIDGTIATKVNFADGVSTDQLYNDYAFPPFTVNVLDNDCT
jgi:hypothetical protein